MLFRSLGNLEQKRTIPTVKAQLSLIEAAQAEEWWIDVTPVEIESLRVKIRDLMQFVDRQVESIIYTDFQDELGELTEVTVLNLYQLINDRSAINIKHQFIKISFNLVFASFNNESILIAAIKFRIRFEHQAAVIIYEHIQVYREL